MIEIVSSAVPPAGMDDGTKVFEIVGRDNVTESASTAEQMPATVQDVDELLLETADGGAMVAVFDTTVCAKTGEKLEIKSKKQAKHQLIMRQARPVGAIRTASQ